MLPFNGLKLMRNIQVRMKSCFQAIVYDLIYGLQGAAFLSKCGAYSRLSLFITFFLSIELRTLEFFMGI